MKKLMKYLGIALITVMVATGIVAQAPAQPAEAASGSQFDAGNIISDGLFYDSQAMSVTEIQRFLVQQVPVCRSSYACLSTYTQNTPNMPAVNGRCGAYEAHNRETAAEIIYRVGAICGISSKVMLVLLEKEQSLVTSSTPSQGRFESATGMGCPDTAPCDPSFQGLFYQIYYAARQFKAYQASPSSWNYQAGRVNNILYHPNRDCGSSPVYIANQATAGLYNYTPYQPNAAALNNMYGSGDGCSAYGNRNFWRIYTDWFGSTQSNTIGANAIALTYINLGGAGGSLGAQLTGVVCSNGYRDCGVQYRAGSIYWSERTGAWPVYDNGIRSVYWDNGGSAGFLGAPSSAPANIPQNGGGFGQAFENGSIFASPPLGVYPVSGAVRGAYFQTRGAAGDFGFPVHVMVCGPAVYGCTQQFQNGYIGSPSGGGAHSATGNMSVAYSQLGGPQGDLGVLASDPVSIPQNGGGVGQAFANGSIYASPAAGTAGVFGPVRAAYFTQGGASGVLGWPTGAQRCISAAGCIQAFQNGYVSASTGASRIITGAFATAYTAAGGTAGVLGAATSDVATISQNGGGTGQAFEGGSIYSRAAGTFSVQGSILTEYFAQSGAAGKLGWPTSSGTCTLAGRGCQQTFQNGTIFSLAGQTTTVSGAIATGYAAAGGLSTLGLPTSGVVSIPQNGGGQGQAFAQGSVYASAAGSFAVSGPTRTAYWAESGSAGALGWPTGANACSTAGVCSQAFQSGVVAGTVAGMFSVSGPTATAYASLGGASGAYGQPTSGLIQISGPTLGTGQVFLNGSIYSSPRGAFGVTGSIRAEYFVRGGSTGSLGWPISAATCSAQGVCSQKFEQGTIAGSAGKSLTVSGAIDTAYGRLGGATGAFGVPTSTVIAIAANGGGQGQVFTAGSIFSSAAGAFGVSGAVRDEYFRQGGAAGALGWPTAAASCTAGSTSCSQSFQGGSITR